MSQQNVRPMSDGEANAWGLMLLVAGTCELLGVRGSKGATRKVFKGIISAHDEREKKPYPQDMNQAWAWYCSNSPEQQQAGELYIKTNAKYPLKLYAALRAHKLLSELANTPAPDLRQEPINVTPAPPIKSVGSSSTTSAHTPQKSKSKVHYTKTSGGRHALGKTTKSKSSKRSGLSLLAPQSKALLEPPALPQSAPAVEVQPTPIPVAKKQRGGRKPESKDKRTIRRLFLYDKHRRAGCNNELAQIKTVQDRNVPPYQVENEKKAVARAVRVYRNNGDWVYGVRDGR